LKIGTLTIGGCLYSRYVVEEAHFLWRNLEVVLCGIDIFYMEHMLMRMRPWHRMWSYLVEEH